MACSTKALFSAVCLIFIAAAVSSSPEDQIIPEDDFSIIKDFEEAHDTLELVQDQNKQCPGGLGSRKHWSGWTCNGHKTHKTGGAAHVSKYCTSQRWQKDVLECCPSRCNAKCPGGLGKRKHWSGWTCNGHKTGVRVQKYCSDKRWKKDVLECCPKRCSNAAEKEKEAKSRKRAQKKAEEKERSAKEKDKKAEKAAKEKTKKEKSAKKKEQAAKAAHKRERASKAEKLAKEKATKEKQAKERASKAEKNDKEKTKKEKATKATKEKKKKTITKRDCKCRGHEVAVDAATAAFLDAMTTSVGDTAQLVQVEASPELATELVQAQAGLKGTTCEQWNGSSGKKWCTVSKSCKAATGVVNNVKIKGKCVPFCHSAGFKVPAKMKCATSDHVVSVREKAKKEKSKKEANKKEKAKKERSAKEKNKKAEKASKEKTKKEKSAKKKEQAKKAAHKREQASKAEKQAKEKAKKEKQAKEKAKKAEKNDKEKTKKEKATKVKKEKTHKDKVSRDKEQAAKLIKEKAAKDKAAAEKRVKASKAAAEKKAKAKKAADERINKKKSRELAKLNSATKVDVGKITGCNGAKTFGSQGSCSAAYNYKQVADFWCKRAGYAEAVTWKEVKGSQNLCYISKDYGKWHTMSPTAVGVTRLSSYGCSGHCKCFKDLRCAGGKSKKRSISDIPACKGATTFGGQGTCSAKYNYQQVADFWCKKLGYPRATSWDSVKGNQNLCYISKDYGKWNTMSPSAVTVNTAVNYGCSGHCKCFKNLKCDGMSVKPISVSSIKSCNGATVFGGQGSCSANYNYQQVADFWCKRAGMSKAVSWSAVTGNQKLCYISGHYGKWKSMNAYSVPIGSSSSYGCSGHCKCFKNLKCT